MPLRLTDVASPGTAYHQMCQVCPPASDVPFIRLMMDAVVIRELFVP